MINELIVWPKKKLRVEMVKLLGVWSFGTRSSLEYFTNFYLGEAGSQSLRAINLFSDILKLYFFFQNWVFKCLILFAYNSFDNSFSKKQKNKLYKTEKILYAFWKWKIEKNGLSLTCFFGKVTPFSFTMGLDMINEDFIFKSSPCSFV